jgi:hypothetical protein
MSFPFQGQVFQDKFVATVLKNKENGFFLEIGSNHFQSINNTYYLEKILNWRGIMVEFDAKWKGDYDIHRTNSVAVIEDATKIDYIKVLEENNAPLNIDYLQIDLDVYCRSTLTTLELLDDTVFDRYKFAVVTFEHDIYNGDHFNTRKLSREIFQKRNYVLVFPDVRCGDNAFEDWYVHPDLVDMDFVRKISVDRSLECHQISRILDENK